MRVRGAEAGWKAGPATMTSRAELEKGGVMERKKWEGASEAGPATMTSRAMEGGEVVDECLGFREPL